MRPIVTEDDKRIVGHLAKKKRASGKGKVHVYYNKKKTKGSSTYLSGYYFSQKNKKYFKYRSSYELKLYHNLEADDAILSYECESIKIPYRFKGSYKNYIPDVISVSECGTVTIYEVKPNAMLDNAQVKAKATACKAFFSKFTAASDVEYIFKFVTETDLFANTKEYREFVEAHKK